MVANILGEVEFTTVLAWLMARENPRLRDARYCEVFAHERDERRPRPTLNSDTSFTFPNPTSRAPFNWVIAMERTRIYEHLRRQLVRVQK